jgi:hypothetical protein
MDLECSTFSFIHCRDPFRNLSEWRDSKHIQFPDSDACQRRGLGPAPRERRDRQGKRLLLVAFQRNLLEVLPGGGKHRSSAAKGLPAENPCIHIFGIEFD